MQIEGDEQRPGEKTLKDQSKQIETLFGPVRITRNAYYDPTKCKSRHPLDEALQLVGAFTPALAGLICQGAAEMSFATLETHLEQFAGLQIGARRLHRLARRIGPAFAEAMAEPQEPGGQEHREARFYAQLDGTGIPLRREELDEVAGRQPDGTARTREVKVAACFTQTLLGAQKEPLRDPDSTTYAATTERCGPFADLALTEARRRAMGTAAEIVVISDAAEWIKRTVGTHFPEAVWVLDWYHATEYIHDIATRLHGLENSAASRQAKAWKDMALRDQIGEVIKEANAQAAALPEDQRELVEQKVAYLKKNQDGMMYGTFRKKNMFIGSGVVEGACKHLVGKRLKQGGMFWSVQGAKEVLSYRTAVLSNRFEEIWDVTLDKFHQQAA